MASLDNLNTEVLEPLETPRTIRRAHPVTAEIGELVVRTREKIRDILHGRDRDRLFVVVGPCSVHDPDAALEYARRLKTVADRVEESLVVVMRTYFEKPRTTVGWKGLINDPHLDGTCDISTGLDRARALLVEVNGLGLPCASEVLDPVTPQYVADLLSWAAVGARTTESQTHREMASGLSMPIGFKNGTDGRLDSAKNALISARSSHSFLGINADGLTSVVKTTGNADGHVVLRGGRDGTNYGAEAISEAVQLVADFEAARPVMIDTSHDNSGKDHTRQAEVCRQVLKTFEDGQSAVCGLLIESNLAPGKQSWKPDVPLEYGVSITDACIGWDETEKLLDEIADAVRRAKASA
ncbi:MAG: 3-deoxy-7-phosphoheptulonate synthase [Candidatus Binatia bacterium]|nr:3-deoxy-7-phosphoheptulonate synthase [Candidatus Binatia bacterium]